MSPNFSEIENSFYLDPVGIICLKNVNWFATKMGTWETL